MYISVASGACAEKKKICTFFVDQSVIKFSPIRLYAVKLLSIFSGFPYEGF